MTIYTAGAYSASSKKKIKYNIKIAREYAIKIWELGSTAVICPHLNTAHMEDYTKNVSWLDFLVGDFEIIKNCNAVFLLPNWKQSKGARREKVFAEQHGIFVTDSLTKLKKEIKRFNAEEKNLIAHNKILDMMKKFDKDESEIK